MITGVTVERQKLLMIFDNAATKQILYDCKEEARTCYGTSPYSCLGCRMIWSKISHRYWNTKLLNKALTLDMNRTEQLNFHQQDKVLRPDSGSQQRSTGQAVPLENPVLKGRIHLLCACVRATQLTDTWECLGLPFPGVHRKCGMSRNALGRFIQFVSHPNSSCAGSSYWQYQHCSGMDFTLINY